MTGSLVGFEAWAALAGDSPTSRTEWSAIIGAWSEPHRRYHGLAHLAAVLGLVGELAGAAADPDAVALAAWYHDVAYDPERDDNEQVSADRARAGLRGLVPEDRVDEVARLVLLTAGHDPGARRRERRRPLRRRPGGAGRPPGRLRRLRVGDPRRVRPPLRRRLHRRADRRPRAAAGPAPGSTACPPSPTSGRRGRGPT